MKTIAGLGILALLGLVGPSGTARAADPESARVIDRYLDAIGGRAILGAIEDRTIKFRNTKHSPEGDTVAGIAQYLGKGYKVREEWDIEGVKVKDQALAFTQVYDGSEGWVLMFGTVSPLEGRTLDLFVWDKFLDDPLAHWKEDGYALSTPKAGEVGGEAVDILEMADSQKSKSGRYSFSKATGLLLKKEWSEASSEEGKPKRMVRNAILYKKYTDIAFSDGSGRKLKVPILQEVHEDGVLDTTREYTELKLNSGLPASLFQRPPGEVFAGKPDAHAGEVKALHILLETSADAEAVRKKILAGGGDRKAFVEAARASSRDPTTKRAGGHLGWFTRQKMVREFSDATFQLVPGKISQPVQTQFGWHLIFVEARGDEKSQPAKPAKDF